jgi:hypothetical protein
VNVGLVSGHSSSKAQSEAVDQLVVAVSKSWRWRSSAVARSWLRQLLISEAEAEEVNQLVAVA